MSWIAVGTTVVGGALQYKGQKDAAKAAERGGQQSAALQGQRYEQARTDLQPYMQLGTQGVSGLQALMADPNSIAQNPAYQFVRDQGLQGLDRSAAARGALWSGGADADRLRYASGLASQEYGNEWNRLTGLVNAGQNTATSLGNLGQGFAANQGNALAGAADARASGYMMGGNTLGQLAYGVGGALNDWNQARVAGRQPQSGWGNSAGSLTGFGNNPGWYT